MKEFFKKCIVIILTYEASVLLKRKKPTIIAITGSVGKTSTKDAVYAVLKNRVHARKSEKSFNSEIGVPLTVLGLRNGWNNPFLWIKNIVDGALHAFFSSEYPEVLVLEMGVDRKGDMKRLTQWIKPDIVVVTCFPDVPAHVEYFGSPQEVIDEKMILVHALKQDGVFIYNNDDSKVTQYVGDIRQKSFGYSRYSQSHFTSSGDKVIYDGASPIGMEFTISHVTQSVKIQEIGSLGVQNAYNFAAALAIGTLFDISLEDGAEQLQDYVTPPGRMKVIRGIENSTLIDDTYNSSPVACELALQTLQELTCKGRKIAVLADMLELGKFSVREHEHIGQTVASKADILFTLGVRSRKIAENAQENGMPEKCIFQYDSIDELLPDLKAFVKQNDFILVKGSQGMRAEKIVKGLMAEPQKASELLVRQDLFWDGV